MILSVEIRKLDLAFLPWRIKIRAQYLPRKLLAGCLPKGPQRAGSRLVIYEYRGRALLGQEIGGGMALQAKR